MDKNYFQDWNKLVYYVSDVYSATNKFKAGKPKELGDKIRKTAISITADFNSPQEKDRTQIYPILSSISVLETYLHLARKYKFLKDTSLLDEKLVEVKDALYRMLE